MSPAFYPNPSRLPPHVLFNPSHDHVPCQSAGKSSKVAAILPRLRRPVKRLERSEAIERLERLEQASVLNSADPGCGDFDPAGFPSAGPIVRGSRILTENGPKKVGM